MPLRVMKPTLSLESMVVRDGYKIEQDFPAVIHQQDLISQLGRLPLAMDIHYHN